MSSLALSFLTLIYRHEASEAWLYLEKFMLRGQGAGESP